MNAKVGVGAVIFNQENQILLVLRKKEPEASYWSLPGGKVEFLETIEDAVIREIKEETNLTIELEKLLCVTNHIFPKDNYHFVAPTFLARPITQKLNNNEPDKLAAVEWFSLNNLPDKLTFTTLNALKYL